MLTYSILEIKVIVRIDVFRFLGLIETLPLQGESRDLLLFAFLTLLSVDSQSSFKTGSEKQKYALNGCNRGYKIVYTDPS